MLFSKKTMPLLIPLVGSIATMMIFLLTPAMQLGQNWMVSVVVAGACAAVSAAGVVVGFISWAKVKGRYYAIPRRVPIAE